MFYLNNNNNGNNYSSHQRKRKQLQLFKHFRFRNFKSNFSFGLSHSLQFFFNNLFYWCLRCSGSNKKYTTKAVKHIFNFLSTIWHLQESRGQKSEIYFPFSFSTENSDFGRTEAEKPLRWTWNFSHRCELRCRGRGTVSVFIRKKQINRYFSSFSARRSFQRWTSFTFKCKYAN